uniref:Dolichyl-diphosphooligosaccharide--protein glycosyltransferase 48 kDa subunit (Trinotate prediction) n=1 Tax=Henneguya salminicola TaxID=69463 RepID=A0A6G3MI45_HENSL
MFTSFYEWAFQQHGVLRIVNATHKLVSSGEKLDEYVVETLLEYSITVQELNKNGKWTPYIADDLQLELERLTIFGRVTYNQTSNGVYTARFFSPDFIGTYGLRTRYRKIGYTPLDHQMKIIIRPRRHNDYDRFIFGAWPYYLTAFIMMGMVYVLVFALLNQIPPKEKSS